MRHFSFFLVLLLWGLTGPACGESFNSSDPQDTPSSQPNPVYFFTFGDQGTGDANQQAVADQTLRICQNFSCHFGLFLGDNFYPSGVSSVSDSQWQTAYRDRYTPLNLTIYAVLGNHDWDGTANAQAEIDYSSQDSSWQMPGQYYSFKYPTTGTPLLEIFVINSNNFTSDTASQSWLTQAIADSQATWKMVAFHHPIFANGSAHTPDEKGMYSTLRPIICNKVNLLLAGHDHFFSHLRKDSDGCGYDQLIIGTGGRSLYAVSPTTNANATVLYTEASFGLGFFEIKADQITFHFYRASGEEAYKTTW